jgi:hypothetical protein|nr:MAG TPA: Blasticidin M [Bacteriophage sp.]
MKREYPYIEGQLLYIAHPYGGDETNKERVQTYLKMLQEKYPEKTLFSPLHNWGYTPYDKEHQHKPMKDCLEVLQRCNALILCGNWRESRGCNQEYAAAYVMDMQIYEMKPTGEICSID